MTEERQSSTFEINRDRRAMSLDFLEKSLSHLPFGFTLIDLRALRNSIQSISKEGVVSPSVHLISADESPSIARRNDHYL